MVDKSNKKIMFKVMFVNVYLLNVRMFVANKVVVQVEFYQYQICHKTGRWLVTLDVVYYL